MHGSSRDVPAESTTVAGTDTAGLSWFVIRLAAALLSVVAALFSSADATSPTFGIASARSRGRQDRRPLSRRRRRSGGSSQRHGQRLGESLVFRDATVETLAFANSLAISGLAVAALTADVVEKTAPVSANKSEDTSGTRGPGSPPPR
jgi:hypothetical protein